MNIRTLDDGLDQALDTMTKCGYTNVQGFRRDQDGHPGIVIDGDRTYTTDEEILGKNIQVVVQANGERCLIQKQNGFGVPSGDIWIIRIAGYRIGHSSWRPRERKGYLLVIYSRLFLLSETGGFNC
jgi:hypothetical protein